MINWKDIKINYNFFKTSLQKIYLNSAKIRNYKLIDTLKYRMKENAFNGKLPVIANIKWS